MGKLLTSFLLVLAVFPAWAQNVDESAYQRYINIELYRQMLPGYYVQGNKKVEAKIKYVPPIEFQDPAVALIVDKGKGEEALPKAKIDGYMLEGHLFVPEDLGDSVVWVLVEREGAIRETIYFTPMPPGSPAYYKVNHLVTNTTTHEGYFVGSLAINFNKIMANITKENPAIAEKVANREQGYRFIDYKKIIAEYNLWFQNEYPKRIKYIGGVPDFQALIDNDVSNYLPKND